MLTTAIGDELGVSPEAAEEAKRTVLAGHGDDADDLARRAARVVELRLDRHPRGDPELAGLLGGPVRPAVAAGRPDRRRRPGRRRRRPAGAPRRGTGGSRHRAGRRGPRAGTRLRRLGRSHGGRGVGPRRLPRRWLAHRPVPAPEAEAPVRPAAGDAAGSRRRRPRRGPRWAHRQVGAGDPSDPAPAVGADRTRSGASRPNWPGTTPCAGSTPTSTPAGSGSRPPSAATSPGRASSATSSGRCRTAYGSSRCRPRPPGSPTAAGAKPTATATKKSAGAAAGTDRHRVGGLDRHRARLSAGGRLAAGPERGSRPVGRRRSAP